MVVPQLPKSGFIARRDAGLCSPLDGGNGHAGKPCFRQSERERDVHGFTGCAVCPQHRATFRLAVDRGRKHKVVGAQVGKEIPVLNHGFRVGQGDFQRCVGRLDRVHLGGVTAVGQHKAVHAEFPVGGAVAEVAAIGKAGLAVRVSDRDAVVHVLPDKATLIQRLFVGILGVVGDAAAAIAHGVAVLAHDKGLFRVLCQKLFDVCHRGVHLAFHIGGGRVFPVPENALVVHKAAGVGAAEILAHLPQGLAAVALVAARPNEDGRVVFVPFQHGFGAGKHILPPLRARTGQRPFVRTVRTQFLPCAVALQIRLPDDIQAVFIAELQKIRVVRVVAGAHGVHVMGFQVLHIPQHLFPADGAAGAAAPLVAVDTLEHDALAVQKHLAVFQLKPAQTDFHAGALHENALAQQGDFCFVQVRLFGTPQSGVSHRKGERNILHVLFHIRGSLALAEHHAAVVLGRFPHLSGLFLAIKHHRHRSCAADFAIKGDGCTGKIICKALLHKDVLQMELRLGEQFHRPEQAAHAPEILILQPAAGGKTVHLYRQGIFAGVDGGGHVKFSGSEGILGVADVNAVAPDGGGTVGTVQTQVAACPVFRQGKAALILPDGVIILRNLAGVQLFVAVPRVLGVDVMGRAVGLTWLLQALHLDEAGHSQGVPVRKGCGQVFRIAEVPLAIQADGQGQFGAGLVGKMGMKGQTVLLENFRVGQKRRGNGMI